MTQIHLPEDIGDTQSKTGEKPIAQSYPFVLAEDALVQYVGIFPPNSEEEEINPIYKPSSENVTDVFALGRQVKSSILFRNVSNYDIEPNQWGYQTGDVSGQLGAGTVSVTWSYRVNARASYTSNTEVKFVPNQSAIELKNYPNSDTEIIQQSMLFSNRYFTASANPIILTMAVKASLSDSPNSVKTWGLYSASSGYFFRMKGSGLANNFVVGYRYSLGGTITEVEIPRSFFNGDKLDGLGTSVHVQTFTNVAMFKIEIGAAGIGARFWAYVDVGNSARWVLVHSLLNDSDSSQDRITDEEGWPICFENINYGIITSTTQTLAKFGVSVTSIGSPTGTTDINLVSGNITPSLSKAPLPVVGIRAKDFINSKKNSSNLLPITLSAIASSGAWRIVLIKNPIKPTSPPLIFNTASSLSAIEYSNQGFFVESGTVLGSYLLAGNKPIKIDLTSLFGLNKAFLTTQYTNDTVPLGDFGQQFVGNADELWVCVVDANIPTDYQKDIVWASLLTINATPSYGDSRASGYDLNANIYVTLSAQEV
jgi:hypothetical protein